MVRRDHDQWQLGLVWHRRLGAWLPTGGHQENCETIEDTAVREAREEAGLHVQLVPLPLPGTFPHPVLATPWWIMDVPAAPDNHTPAPHLHRDHVFVGEVTTAAPAAHGECELHWFTRGTLCQAADVSEDSRMQGMQVLACLAQVGDPACRSDGART